MPSETSNATLTSADLTAIGQVVHGVVERTVPPMVERVIQEKVPPMIDTAIDRAIEEKIVPFIDVRIDGLALRVAEVFTVEHERTAERMITYIDDRFAKERQYNQQQFDLINHRLNRLEHRFDQLEHRFDQLEQRFDQFEQLLKQCLVGLGLPS